MVLTLKTKDIIKASAPLVASHAIAITSNFYPRLFKNNPEVKVFFNKANQAKGTQPQALADAVIAYASNIDNISILRGAVAKITNRHCALGVTPEFYPIIHDNLMLSIIEILGDAVTPEIGKAWSDAIMALAKICMDEEEELYLLTEQREGGWRGYKDFTLVKKKHVGVDTVAFTFQACDSPNQKIDFTPGQYLSIRCEAASETPRHYTVTNNPGQNILQCITRHMKSGNGNPEGAMSSFMHMQMKEGDIVKLAAPYGVFTKYNLFNKFYDESKVIFVTAGIGITIARSLCKDLNCTGMIHVDKSEDHTGELVKLIEKDAGICAQKLFGQSRISNMETIKDAAVANPNAHFILCGPLGFMKGSRSALKRGGAKNIHCELFGTGKL